MSILKLALSYSLIEVIQKGIYFLIIPLLTYYISVSEYGNIAIVLMIISIFQVFFTFSLETVVMRFYIKIKNETLKKKFLGTVFKSSLLFILFWNLFLLIIGPFVFQLILPKLSFFPYIFLAILIVSFKLINLFYITLLKATQNIKEYAKFYNIYFFLQTLFIIIFVVVFHYKKDLLYLFGLLLSQIIMLGYIFMKIKKNINFEINKKLLKISLNYSFSIIPIKFVNIVNSSIDRYILLSVLGSSLVGIYYLALQISSVIQIFMLALNSAYVPKFFKLYESNKNKSNFKEIYNILNNLILISGVIEAVALHIYKYVFIFMKPEYNEAKIVVPFLVFYFSLGIIYYINTNILSINAFLNKKKIYGILIGILLNIFVSILLVKYMGIIGVAIGTIVGFLVSIIYFIFLVHKYTNIRPKNCIYISYISSIFLFNYFIGSFYINIFINLLIIIFFLKTMKG